MLEHQIIDAAARSESLLSDLGRILVTDVRVESSHHADTVLHVIGTALAVGRNAVHAERAERIEAVHQQLG